MSKYSGDYFCVWVGGIWVESDGFNKKKVIDFKLEQQDRKQF